MPVSKNTFAKLRNVVTVSRHVTDLGQALAFVAYVELHRKHLSPAQWHKLKVASTGYTGIKDQRKSRATGTTVSIYDSVAQGIEAEERDERGRLYLKWSVVCEDHGTCVCTETMHQARHSMSHPEWFCDECRALLGVLDKR